MQNLFQSLTSRNILTAATVTILTASTLLSGTTHIALAADGALEAIQYNSHQQALSIRSTGPMKASMNSILIDGKKRIIIDIENAAIGNTIPRDIVLLKQLSQQWDQILNISLNHFGGSKPIVRLLVDVKESAGVPQLVTATGNTIELKLVQPSVATKTVNTPNTPVATPAASQPTAVAPISGPNPLNQELEQTKEALRLTAQKLTWRDAEVRKLKKQLQDLSTAPPQAAPSSMPNLNGQADLQKQLDERNKQIQVLQGELASLQTKLTEASNRPAAISPTQDKEKNQVIQALQGKLSDSTEQQKKLEKDLVEAKRQQDALKQKLAEQTAYANKEMAAIREQLKKRATRRSLQENQSPERVAEIQTLQASIDKLKQDNHLLETQLIDLAGKYQAALNTAGVKAVSAPPLKASGNKSTSEAQALQVKLADLQDKFSVLQESKARQEEELTAVKTKLTALEQTQATEEKGASSQKLAKKDKTIKALNETNKGLEKQLASLQAELKQRQDNITAANELPAIKEENEKLIQELTSTKASLQSMQSAQSAQNSALQEREQLKKELSSLKGKFSALNTEAQSLRAQLKQATLTAASAVKPAPTKPGATTPATKGSASGSTTAASTATPTVNTVAIQQENQTLKQQLQGLKASINTLKQSNKSLESQLLESGQKMQTLEEALKEAKSSQSTVANSEPEKVENTAPAEPESKALQKLKQKLGQTQQENQTLNKEISALKTQLQQLSRLSADKSTGEKPVNKPKGILFGNKGNKSVASVTGDNNEGKPAITNLNAEKHFEAGKAAEAKGDLAEALLEYEKASNLDPTSSRYALATSTALLSNKQYAKAQEIMKRLIKQEPQNRDAYNQLGKAYLLQGSLPEAQDAFSKAIHVGAMGNYANTLKRQGKFEEAEKFLKIALVILPGDSDLLFNLGNLYNSRKDYIGAKEAYEKAISLRPDFAEAHYNLGLVYSKEGDKPNAILHLEKYLQLSPEAANRDAVSSFVSKLKG